ncbi:MAG TPA: 2-phospho-L-lactate transferase [Terriglobales bacterium]|nr:2-phospho-L-lactate transferase [Terriglobales bacterium]
MIVVITGGTGGAKFVQGIQSCMPPEELTCVVNTGDDLLCWGLHISPDLDSITYALAGLLSKQRGWGVEGDTFECLEVMKRLGAPAWFQLGDRDLALHISRTAMLAAGKTLSAATAAIAGSFGIRSRILPMADARVETRIATDHRELSFQEYFVRERYQVPVHAVRFEGAATSKAAPGVVDAILSADAVLIAPSNPITSIGPILAIPAIKQALQATAAPVGAVSPIVGGAAVSGPAGELMALRSLEVSGMGIAAAYRDFLDVLVLDERDAHLVPLAEKLGLGVLCTNSLMKTDGDKAALAQAALQATLASRSKLKPAAAVQR